MPPLYFFIFSFTAWLNQWLALPQMSNVCTVKTCFWSTAWILTCQSKLKLNSAGEISEDLLCFTSEYNSSIGMNWFHWLNASVTKPLFSHLLKSFFPSIITYVNLFCCYYYLPISLMFFFSFQPLSLHLPSQSFSSHHPLPPPPAVCLESSVKVEDTPCGGRNGESV